MAAVAMTNEAMARARIEAVGEVKKVIM